jgi:hypothetical protein
VTTLSVVEDEKDRRVSKLACECTWCKMRSLRIVSKIYHTLYLYASEASDSHASTAEFANNVEDGHLMQCNSD